jgi:hypothetical protein
MFCSRCGTAIPPNAFACSQCGRRVGDPVSALAQSRLERHLDTLGMLWIAIGGLFVIPALILAALSPVRVFLQTRMSINHAFGSLLFSLAIASLAIMAAGGICVGLGLMQRRSWARAAALILGVLALFHPPLGTALGIYTLWIFLADEHGNEYRYLVGVKAIEQPASQL